MPQFQSIHFEPYRPLQRELSADRLNSILAEIRRNRPIGGKGISIRTSGTGTVISAAETSKSKIVYPDSSPWDIYISKREGQGGERIYTLKVFPGTISNILPSNWDEEFTANNQDLYYGIARITTDGKLITEVTIDITDSPPQQQTPEKFGIEENVEYLFGMFKSGTSFNVLNQSIYLYPRLRLVTSADPAAAPGESPFDLWYELAT